MTIEELTARHERSVQSHAEFWQRVRDEAITARAAQVEKRRAEKRLADCERPGISVWEVDEAGKVLAKFVDGIDAERHYGYGKNVVNATIRRNGQTKDGRRFIRCGVVSSSPPVVRGRQVRRLSDGKVFRTVKELLPDGPDWRLRYAVLWKAILNGRPYMGERYEFVGPGRWEAKCAR